jgi:hypothetical protein
MKKLFLFSTLLLLIGSAFAQQTLYRYYNPKLGKHYYTTNFNEYGNGANDWYLDGPQCQVFDHGDRDRGLIPLFRYFNGGLSDHYYTTNFEELGRGSNGYAFEGKACFIAKNPGPRLVPLFGYYNRISGEHFLTTDKGEVARGFDNFQYTGVVGYVILIDRDANRARDRGRDSYRDHH